MHKYKNSFVYTAFCLGALAPSAILIAIGVIYDWPEVTYMLPAALLCMFQFYFLGQKYE